MSVYTNNKFNKNAPNDAWYKIFGFVPKNSTILDVGCSSGELGAALKKEKHVHIVGVDIDKDDVEIAKKNLDDAFIFNLETDDIATLGTYDIIIMADVIEHLIDPVTALKKVKMALKPGGKFIFSIPNMANITTRIDLLGGVFMYKEFGLLDRTHLHFYDQIEVNRVLKEAGFTVDKMDCTMREIPDQILEERLDSLGIKLSSKLKLILNQSDATVYQFIGVASPGKTTHAMPVESTSELDIISVEMRRLQERYTEDIDKSREEAILLRNEIKRLSEELSAILNSKGWSMLTKFYTAKSKITNKAKK